MKKDKLLKIKKQNSDNINVEVPKLLRMFDTNNRYGTIKTIARMNKLLSYFVYKGSKLMKGF